MNFVLWVPCRLVHLVLLHPLVHLSFPPPVRTKTGHHRNGNVLPDLEKPIFRFPFTFELVLSIPNDVTSLSQRDMATGFSVLYCLSSLKRTNQACLGAGLSAPYALGDAFSKRSHRVYYFVRPCHSCAFYSGLIKIAGPVGVRVP